MRDRSAAGLSGWFAATVFLGAFLLFQVQPLFSKMILPWFGGSPAVWTTCLLFFQTVLLAGYAYAHGLSQLQPASRQVIVHLTLAALALLLLVKAIKAQGGRVECCGASEGFQGVLGMLGRSLPFDHADKPEAEVIEILKQA